MKKIIDNIIRDIKVELDEEFDRNFERCELLSNWYFYMRTHR
jgi:hypothetical protein